MLKNFVVSFLLTLCSIASWANTIGLPGSHAFSKDLWAGLGPHGHKIVSINLTGFNKHPSIVSSDKVNEVQIHWKLLAQNQTWVDPYANRHVPSTHLLSDDFVEVNFRQLNECRSISKVTINGEVQYVVSGVCIEEPTLIIPADYKGQIILNGEVIYLP